MIYIKKYIKYIKKNNKIIGGTGSNILPMLEIINTENNIDNNEINELLSSITHNKLNIHNYSIEHTIGQGSFGTTYKAFCIINNEQKYVAIKSIFIEDIQKMKKIINELNILCSLDYDNIVKCYGYDYVYTDTEKIFYIIMEYIDGKPLECINDLSLIKNYGKQILNTLKYLHDNNIVHMDIKPHNILLLSSSNTIKLTKIKLIDFGESQNINKYIVSDSGTLSYMAPEIRKKNFIGIKNYLKLADIWSFGILLANMYICNINKIYKQMPMSLPFNYELYISLIFFEIAKKYADKTDINIFFIQNFIDSIKNSDMYNLCFVIFKCLTIEYTQRPNTDTLLSYDFFKL